MMSGDKVRCAGKGDKKGTARPKKGKKRLEINTIHKSHITTVSLVVLLATS